MPGHAPRQRHSELPSVEAKEFIPDRDTKPTAKLLDPTPLFDLLQRLL
jgi:hypothetical protein